MAVQKSVHAIYDNKMEVADTETLKVQALHGPVTTI